MSRELEFFTMDEKRAKLIQSLSEIIEKAPERLAETPAKLQEVREELKETESRLLEKFGSSFRELRSKLEWLLRQLVEHGFIKHEEHDKFSRCLSIVEEAYRSSDLKEVVLCVEGLSRALTEISFILCRSPKEEFEQMCSAMGEIASLNLYKLYEHYRELRKGAEALSALSEYASEEGSEEEYASLAELAKLYREFKRENPYFDYYSTFIREVNRSIVNNEDVFLLLKNLKDLAEIGKADLVKAYSYLVKLVKSLSIESMEGWRHVRRSAVLRGVEPALAFVLAHVTERVGLDELVRELEVYVRSELSGPGRGEEKVRRLYLNLVKIVSLPLCLVASRVDRRLAIALGLTATRYWSKWYDTHSFTALCGGLRTLSRYASEEEVERLLVYVTLFGDFDFIVKLDPLLRKYRSLRSLTSRF